MRGFARRRVRAVYDLAAGFVYSAVLHACVELRAFEMLAAGPLPLAACAARLGLAPDPAARLVRAAVALKLLAWEGEGVVALGPHGAAVLGNPALGAMILHNAAFARDLQDPVALLRGTSGSGRLRGLWSYAAAADPRAAAPEAVAAYTRLMAETNALLARDLLDAYPFARHSRLLDIGGGEGAFLLSAAARAPQLALCLFDLPAVAEQARVRLAAAGLADRADIHGGDLFADPLPAGADLATLLRVLHDHDDAPAMTILRRARAALGAGGVLLIAEPMAATPGAEPAGDAYFGLYLLAMGSGRPRTAAELLAMSRAAGFRQAAERRMRNPLVARLIVARV